MINLSLQGPGFFMFFRTETVTPDIGGIYKPYKGDDQETVELVQILISFLNNAGQR